MTDDVHTGFGELSFSQDDLSTTVFVVKQLMNGMATAALVQVKAVKDSTVNVQPMVNQIDGTGKGIAHGIINGLPWFSLRAGAAEIRAKPVVGDIGVAIFCQSDSSAVKNTKAPANPGSRRRFDWADGLYLGGFLGPEATTYVDVAEGQIEVKATTIKLTGDVQVTGKLTASDDVIASGKSLKSHTHGGVQAGSGTSGPPS